MPLKQGASQDIISFNIAELQRSGYADKQAKAIAESEARRYAQDESDVARSVDANGWIEIKGNPISKAGVFPYLGRSISPKLQPDKVYMVLRPPEELANPDTIDSFRMIPWIDGHEMLGPDFETPADEKGIRGIIGSEVFFDDDDMTLRGNIKLFSDQLRDCIDSGEKKELSAGMRCKYDFSSGVWNGQHYDVVQRSIRGNHLASVLSGRMGPEVSVQDHLTFIFDAKDITMADETKKDGENTGEKKEMTLAEVNAALEKIMPEFAAMKAHMESMAGPANKDGEADSTTATDEDTEKKDGDDKGKEKGTAMDKKDFQTAMDAAIAAAVKPLNDTIEAMKKGGIKGVLSEVAARNALAQDLSNHVGVFDHADMTLEEVASYGFAKLELPKEFEGNKVMAVKGFLHGRKAPSVSIAMDSNDGKKSEVDAYLKGTKAA